MVWHNLIIHFIIHHKSKLTPWANGILLPKFIVQVDLRIYCFHESEPFYLPPPVSFYPPNAPPISAPAVPMLACTIPQSEPWGPTHRRSELTFCVKILLLNPWGTLLLRSIAYSRLVILLTNKIGQKYYSWRIGEFLSTSTIVGSTK